MPDDRQVAALRARGCSEEADAVELARSPEGKAEALRRVHVALELIERAQHDLERACQELSGLIGAIPPWKRAGALAEQTHGLWRWISYQWLSTRSARSLELDGSAALSFLRRRREVLAKVGREP